MQLDAWGTTAIARVDPTKSVADTSVLVGELLREGLPSLVGAQSWKERSATARSAGGEYLNYQFGWVPLVSEVRALATAVKDAERILKQYERDAGRVVRRRFDFPIEQERSEYVTTSHGIPFTTHSWLGGEKTLNVATESSQKVWFSGAFQYYIPKGDSAYSKLNKYLSYADKLLGIELTPETLWNLAPWSWAIDWFSNVGDVIHNVSAFKIDDLVMRYGYIMCHQSVKRRASWGATTLAGGQSSAGWYEIEKYRKLRRPATPYGFGLELGSLSAYQWSILVALGLTKRPHP
jgi:hypothetical protein